MADDERDELAKLLAEHADWEWLGGSGDILCDCGDVLGTETDESGEYLTTGAHSTHLADVITTANYRKPRTVTTEAELDALPVGSVIRSELSGVFEKQQLSDDYGTVWAYAGDTHDYTPSEVIGVRDEYVVLHVGGTE